MNAHEQRMCEMQGEFFALSTKRFSCSSALFISRFMYSELAKELDQVDDPYNFNSPNHLISTMATLYPSLNKEQGAHMNEIVMRWLGYTYRAWSIIKHKESSWIYKNMKAERMLTLYDAFHTFSPEYCVDQLEQIASENNSTRLSDYEVYKRIRIAK